ncbi:formate dehydrogenase accessory sulfurtransferase FdhD [Thalassotalea sp. G2M2-11]|uniref:formate dehydrogenase accessory sulfurtransferase FdhD n=1 Tax=Thalassotalea sp. G2M2-11 TaxID=2787627 RepID=UPI0019D198D6|nr:formate dehydrogenase accessory sulfurtransferase FdhD [Thalassotalea sp. G2M2-11]
MTKQLHTETKDDNLLIDTVSKYVYHNNSRQLQHDNVIVELPLQIRLLWTENNQVNNKVFTITMRTPGNDQQLITGLLFCEGVIQTVQDIDYISPDHESNNQWEVKLNNQCQPQLSSLERFQVSYSSCGLCGTTSLKSLELKSPPHLSRKKQWLATDVIYHMPKKMRDEQLMFDQTGGVHAAALFDQHAKLIDIYEDIGRHNALDKLIGHLIATTTAPLDCSALVISSRVSFEIIQKAVMAGIPVLIAVGAPTALAIKAAKRFNLTLIGFASAQTFNLYHGQWRLKEIPEETKCRKT